MTKKDNDKNSTSIQRRESDNISVRIVTSRDLGPNRIEKYYWFVHTHIDESTRYKALICDYYSKIFFIELSRSVPCADRNVRHGVVFDFKKKKKMGQLNMDFDVS